MRCTKINTRKHTNHQKEGNPTMNTTKINKTAETANLLAANPAATQAPTDARNTPTGQQQADSTSNVGHNDTAAAAIAPGGNPARLVDDEWRRAIGGGNPAASEYVRGLETLLNDIDTDAPYRAELWDGADPEGEESFPPSTTPTATPAKPATCTRTPRSTRRSPSPPTKRNTGPTREQTRGEREAPTRTRASRFTSIRAKHKKNKHPRYSPISGKPAKHRPEG